MSDPLPNVLDLPGPRPGEAVAHWLDRLLLDHEERWYGDHPVLVEAYLGAFPALAAAPEQVLELIANEMRLRCELRQQPALEEYLTRFPTYAEEVTRQWQVECKFAADELDPTTPNAPVTLVEEPRRNEPIPPLPEVPSVFRDRYRLEQVIGQTEGHVGRVYLAEDLQLHRRVVLKVPILNPRDREEIRQRFLREAQAAAQFHHEHICPIWEFGEENGVPFLIMPYLEGGSLAWRLEVQGPLPVREAVELVRTLARTMQHAHASGVIHRDLKPGNVLFDEQGQPLVADFGLARWDNPGTVALTGTGQGLGTPLYAAPEQLAGQRSDARSDVYSLGMLLFVALTGRPPFAVTTAYELIHKLATEPLPAPSRFRPEVGPDVDDVCLQALSQSPERRQSDMAELASQLERCLNGSPRPRSQWRKRVAAVLAVGVAMLLGAGLWWLGTRGANPEQRGNTSRSTAAVPRVSLATVLHAVRNHLLNEVEHDDRPFQRYFTLHQRTGRPEFTWGELETYQGALADLLVALNAGKAVPRLRVLPGCPVVFALDLRDLDWSNDRYWDEVRAQYPYGLRYDDSELNLPKQGRDEAAEIYLATGSAKQPLEVPLVRADWFLAAASRPPLAEQLRRPEADADLPCTERVRVLAQRFTEGPLTLEVAASELDLEASEELRRKIIDPAALLPAVLLPLATGGSISRADWEARDGLFTPFQDTAGALQRGIPCVLRKDR